MLYLKPTLTTELLGVRETLATLVGPDLALAASQNTEGHVPPRVSWFSAAVSSLLSLPLLSNKVLRNLQPKVSAQDIDHYLVKIAQSFNIQWTPGMSSRQKCLVSFSSKPPF